MEEDDLHLSAGDFDSLERSALQRLSQSRGLPSPSSSLPPQTQHQKSPFSDTTRCNMAEDFNRKTGTNSDGCSKDLPKSSVKLFLQSNGNLGAKFQYDEAVVNAVRKIPKATWNPKERVWTFPLSSLSTAEKILAEQCGPSLQVASLHPLVHRAIAAASASPDLQEKYGRMPGNVESKLLPFQRDGVRFALQHGARVLIADEMGLGKTLQAIAVAACIRESWPALVLTPSSLRLHWATMIQQWLDIPPSEIIVLLSQCGGTNRGGFRIVFSNTRGNIQLNGLFNIISYDVVPKLHDVLMSSNFKLVIADESHFLKNAQAKRTNASLPVIKKAEYALLLSGTPALSRPIELYKQLEALYPDVYRNVHEYGQHYCKGGIFGVYQGASNHEELHSLMKVTVMIRRLKKDVLSQLPVKRRQQVFLELADRNMKKINALFIEEMTTCDILCRNLVFKAESLSWLKALKERIKTCSSKEEADSLKFSQKNLINKIYTDSAEAKIPAVLDYLETVIEAGCKFLIFAHHQPMIDAIHGFLLKKKVGCIRIDGNTPPVARQALVTDFQEKDAIMAAVLSIRAGGVGLTLTAASTVIFAELSWTPGDLIQAEDRVHRIGQVSSVNIYYLLANDTVDDIIWDVVQSKLENLGQVLDGHENALEVSTTQINTPSPSKQKSALEVSSSQINIPSPSKQKSLDMYLKRCSREDDTEHQPKLKFPRR